MSHVAFLYMLDFPSPKRPKGDQGYLKKRLKHFIGLSYVKIVLSLSPTFPPRVMNIRWFTITPVETWGFP